jgi:hypothetical protein
VFASLECDLLAIRWEDAFRGFSDLGQERTFINIDRVFESKNLLSEALVIERSKTSVRVFLLLGAVLSFAAMALLRLFEQSFEFSLLSPFIILSVAFLLSLAYLVESESKFNKAKRVLGNTVRELKRVLPCMGDEHLIHTLFLLQKEQSEDLLRQTADMKAALTDFTTNTLSAQIGTRFEKSITTHLAPAIQKMADVQTDLLHRLQTDQHKRLDQLFTLFTKQVGDLLGQQLSGMSESVASATAGMEKVVASFDAVRQGVDRTLDQNRETADHNQSTLEKLVETQAGLAERFSDASLLLDDVMSSMKILADTTGNANTATLMLSEQAARLQLETSDKLEALRSTLDERLNLTAATLDERLGTVATTLDDRLNIAITALDDQLKASMTTLDERQAGTVALMDQRLLEVVGAMESQRAAFGENTNQLHGALTEHVEGLRIAMDGFVSSFQQTAKTQADTAAEQQKEQTEAMLGTVFLEVRAMTEHTTEMLKQAQAWSLDVSEKFSCSANEIFSKLEKHNHEISQEIQSQGRTNANLLTLTNKTLTDTIANQNKVFEQYSSQLMEILKADADAVIRSMHKESEDLLQVLPTQMREAFDAFTASMGDTMRSTLTDSVEIIDKLGEKTAQLHSEFELYFSRSEGNTDKVIDDLRFAMEGALVKFTELSNNSLEQMRTGNQEAMTMFSEQTKQLMEAVDEQTRTLSLYVKDMGIDMAELNKGLKESVADFSEQLKNGVNNTFEEFDTGLSDVVRRMMELNLSMKESIQALPEAMAQLTKKG